MILIPALNEAGSIGCVTASALKWGLPVVVVDDGSSDSTAGEAENAGARVLLHDRNRGKGAALTTGFDHALQNGFDAVITLDGDGQHDPSEIGLFIEEYRRNGADIIVGSRMSDVRDMPRIRRFTNRASSFMVSRITGVRITDSQSGFRLVKTRAWQDVAPRLDRFDAEPELLFGAARKFLVITEIPISTIYKRRKSSIAPLRDTWRFLMLAFYSWMERGFGKPGGQSS
jgi:glycosyltransferase involved in cell wall biosynthesis